MATLSGQTIANTFDSLLHVEDDTAGLVATSTDSRVIQDGVGAASALALATDSVRITSTNKFGKRIEYTKILRTGFSKKSF